MFVLALKVKMPKGRLVKEIRWRFLGEEIETWELGKTGVHRGVNILRNQRTQWGGGGKMCVKIEFT